MRLRRFVNYPAVCSSEWNMMRMYWSPRPLSPFGRDGRGSASEGKGVGLGEGEGEGLPRIIDARTLQIPHLGPLPLSKGRGERISEG